MLKAEVRLRFQVQRYETHVHSFSRRLANSHAWAPDLRSPERVWEVAWHEIEPFPPGTP